MIELQRNQLVFTFPEVHEDARLAIDFQRTLRIPDDGRDYPLPPGFAPFPLEHVDDHAEGVPEKWLERGGVMLPMYQAEALWISFESASISGHAWEREPYPFAVKIATGKVNAVTGEPWRDGLNCSPQDYVVSPTQPWLDGYCVDEGVIRQFVAMPLGSGYGAEEQITGEAEWGGLQVQAFPMKREVYEKRFPKKDIIRYLSVCEDSAPEALMRSMSLAPGGRMRQQIFEDPFDFQDWDLRHSSRCFVHLADSMIWRQITGKNPPKTPVTAHEYESAGLPWFEFYEERPTAGGAESLASMQSIAKRAEEKGDAVLPENQSLNELVTKQLQRTSRRLQVREW